MKTTIRILIITCFIFLLFSQHVSAAPRMQIYDHVYVAPDQATCDANPSLIPCYTDIFTAIDNLVDSSASTLTFIGTNYIDNSTTPIRSGPKDIDDNYLGEYPLTIDSLNGEGQIIATGTNATVPIFEIMEGDFAFRDLTIVCLNDNISAIRMIADGVEPDGNLAITNTNIDGCYIGLIDDGGIGDVLIVGNTFNSTGIASASPINYDAEGSILAFANNFIGFTYSLRAQSYGIFNLSHNWWGVYDDATMPTYEVDPPSDSWWNTRLGAEIVDWNAGIAPLGATLGIAQLTGGSDGINVIVTFGRSPSNAPFGNGIEPWVSSMCSDYYDFFTIEATSSDPYTIVLPVDLDTACHEEVWAKRDVFFIPASPTNDTQFDLCASSPTLKTCWPMVNAATLPSATLNHYGLNDLEISGLTYVDLGGTPFVAGSFEGTNPTALTLVDFTAQSSPSQRYIFPVLGFFLVVVFASQFFKRKI